MPLTEREKQTQERYDVSAREWFEHSGGSGRPCFWAEEMAEYAKLLNGNRKVLEVGCGPATDGKYLDKLGANTLSTDYSETMLSIAKEENPEGRFMKMDMQDLYFRKNTFDGFWATACLLHLEDPRKALSELVRVTKAGGVGFISVKEGESQSIDPKTQFFFRYYKGPEFQKILEESGLQLIKFAQRAGTPNHDWLTYLVRVTK